MRWKLYFRDDLVGVVKGAYPEDYGFWGKIQFSPGQAQVKAFLEFFTDESQIGKPVPFDDSYFEDWCLEDDTGVRQNISPPGLHPDGSVWWHWSD